MPFLFYNAASAGGQLSLVTSDQTSVGVELRDAGGSAVDIGYTPADPLAWAVPPPGNVAESLDELALYSRANRVSHSIPAATGVFPYIFDSPDFFVPVKSGRYLLLGQIGGTMNSSQQVTLSLRVDGVGTANSNATTFTPFAAGFSLTVFTLVTMDRTLNHSVGASMGASGGTVSSGFFRWMCYEL